MAPTCALRRLGTARKSDRKFGFAPRRIIPDAKPKFNSVPLRSARRPEWVARTLTYFASGASLYRSGLLPAVFPVLLIKPLTVVYRCFSDFEKTGSPPKVYYNINYEQFRRGPAEATSRKRGVRYRFANGCDIYRLTEPLPFDLEHPRDRTSFLIRNKTATTKKR